MKYLASLLFSLILVGSVMAQSPKVSSGSIRSFPDFQSKFIEARKVEVWLPEGYSPDNRYPVLYMHDGQMLFDSTNTWNHQEWQVDEVMGKMIEEGKIPPTIVVGIWNNGALRHSDYFPEKPIAAIPKSTRDSLIAEELQGKPRADAYLKFLTSELKPFIDTHFSTLPDRDHTFIMGSSMGGLISWYALCEYPQIFGKAACMSTHWVGSLRKNDPAIPAAFAQYLRNHLPSPEHHAIYFDYGTKTLDSLYAPYQKDIDEVMKAKGYAGHWETRKFVGADHSERSWSKRLHTPLLFLLGDSETK